MSNVYPAACVGQKSVKKGKGEEHLTERSPDLIEVPRDFWNVGKLEFWNDGSD
jgi:hypothetical protein